MASWRRGGGQLVDIALRDVVAHALAYGPRAPDDTVEVRARAGGGWEVVAGAMRQLVAPPRARCAADVARPLGADTDTVLRDLAA
jgi:crotonobetainyl-CoA:carnitine CoA-transferase CaiB-like acyl-CoA transferase